MRGYEAMADALVHEGVDTIFVVLSEDSLLFVYDIVKNRGVRLISCRNERGAAAMADGYFRSTGRIGVCVVTAGPGLTNTATSLTTANRFRSSVLCITTTPAPTTERHFPKTSDQRLVSEATAGKYIRVRQPQTLAEDFQLAFRHVRNGFGPAVLSVPQDILDAELDVIWEYSLASTRMRASHVAYPDPETVEIAVDMLAATERSVILAGRGAVAAGAEAEIRALAERTGALVATTLKAKGYIGDNPYNVGLSGTLGSDLARSLLPESDCLLAVGASLSVHTTQFGFLYPKAKIIHVDNEAWRIGEHTPVDLGIVADGKATLAAINTAWEKRQPARKQGWWNQETRSRIAESRSMPTPDYVTSPDTIDPRLLVAKLDRLLPKDRVTFLDGGHSVYFVHTGFSTSAISTVDFASIGMGMFQGIGAAVGRPDKRVVVFAGDGGLMMSLEELDTIARHNIPLTVVIMNDNSYSAEVRFLEARGRPTDLAFFTPRDFAAVARDFGVESITVRNSDDLKAAAERISKGNGPLLIDAKTNVNVVHETWRTHP